LKTGVAELAAAAPGETIISRPHAAQRALVPTINSMVVASPRDLLRLTRAYGGQ
jgi:hypothetical protein